MAGEGKGGIEWETFTLLLDHTLPSSLPGWPHPHSWLEDLNLHSPQSRLLTDVVGNGAVGRRKSRRGRYREGKEKEAGAISGRASKLWSGGKVCDKGEERGMKETAE